jgi:hypothetical protein
MEMTRKHAVGAGLAAVLTVAAIGWPVRAAQEQIDLVSIEKIKAMGLTPATSQVMEIASWLTDVHGPRLSGSPNIQKAGEWAVAKMKEWGLTNVALEPWDDQTGFPQGWSNDKFYLAQVSPQQYPMYAMSQAWSPGTKGLVRGEAVLITSTDAAEVQKYAGKLRGKFVLTQNAPEVVAYFDPQARRYTTEQLDNMEKPAAPRGGGAGDPAAAGRGGRQGRGGGAAAAGATPAGAPAPPEGCVPVPFNRNEFFLKEGVIATLTTNPRGHGLFINGGGSRTADPATMLPAIVVAAEHYGRIVRQLAKNIPVTLEADIRNTYHPKPTMFNVIGEIRGTDKADEVVMLGAHFDSWHGSTGATDNAAGSAAMMEAMRILKASGVPLRRTVRIGLWNGEEQGLIGSAQYVRKHYAARGTPPPQPQAQPAAPPVNCPPGMVAAAAGGGRGGGRGGAGQAPLELKPEHAKFSGYFNIDNGTGAIRGVYLQGNEAIGQVFRAWMGPFKDVGMNHLNPGNTGGTDHGSFDNVGLPGFQFIQDSIEYSTITHHYNMDSYERLQAEDMRKNATIAAAFAFLAANRDQLLPRKPAAGAGRGGGQ